MEEYMTIKIAKEIMWDRLPICPTRSCGVRILPTGEHQPFAVDETGAIYCRSHGHLIDPEYDNILNEYEQSRKKQFWICDHCGDKINSLKDGYVQWVLVPNGSKYIGRDMHIVHRFTSKPGCIYNEHIEFSKDKGTVADDSLEFFYSVDGLTNLLMKIEENEIPTKQILEIIKRIHIPGYEAIRHHVKKAIAEGVIEPDGLDGYYNQFEIKAIINKYNLAEE